MNEPVDEHIALQETVIKEQARRIDTAIDLLEELSFSVEEDAVTKIEHIIGVLSGSENISI